MRANRRIVEIVAGVALSFAGVAQANALTDLLPAEAIGTGEAARAQASGTMSPWMNPAGAAMSQTYVVGGTYGYRGEDKASMAAVAVCDSVTTRIGTCVSYNFVQMGEEDTGQKKTHAFGLTLAVPIAETVALGVTGRYVTFTETGMFLAPEDDSREGEIVMDAGTTVRVGGGFQVAAVGYNLVGADEANFPRAIGGGVAWGGESFSITADGVWNLQAPEGESTGRYGVGAQYFAQGQGGQAGYPIRIGYINDVGTEAQFVTAGLGLVTPRVALDLAMRKQVAGDVGDELMFQAGLRLFLPN